MTQAITGDYVLQMAERVERNAVRFYELAAGTAPAGARPVLLGLAAREAEHERQFQDLRARLALAEAPPIDPQGDVASFIRGLMAGRFFDPAVDPASFFTGAQSFRDLLLTAIGLEKDSITFYQGVKALLSEEKDLEVLDTVIRAEVGHIAELAHELETLDGR
jgi:rubrerythrin